MVSSMDELGAKIAINLSPKQLRSNSKVFPQVEHRLKAILTYKNQHVMRLSPIYA